ncbi:MAG: chemotaxis response regulator protein-glutamate methylesterase [Chloroflexota bacterium]|nr:chemotaxis response regulator protein-glutamate methylesterase [Chloroflexota bacterium]
MTEQIRVLVVDDSAFMRSMIGKMLNEVPGIQVVDVAVDGQDAVEKVRNVRPDVVTLDVEMPKMNGIQALEYIMKNCPTPVIMLSSLTQQGAVTTIEALEKGAVDFVGKPSGTVSIDIHRVRDELVNKILRASKLTGTRLAALSAPRPQTPPLQMPPLRPIETGRHHVVAIGTSTGGPKALNDVLPRLPRNLPAPVLVVQHMPPGFTRALAQRLNDLSQIAVREAAAGDQLEPGVALVAPGDFHMTVSSGRIALNQDPPVHNVRPAVDVLLSSLAKTYGRETVGVVLTGMGTDGAEGALAIKRMGGRVIAQDEATSVVYGMPRSVVDAGAADVVAPLGRVADEIVKALS